MLNDTRGAGTIPARTSQLRQGDVLLVRVDVTCTAPVTVPRDGGRVVLAYGEVTGHAHAIREPRPLRAGGRPAILERTGPVRRRARGARASPLDPGTYEVVLQREYVPPVRSRHFGGWLD